MRNAGNDEIKKFIAEQDLNKDVRYIPPRINDYGKPIGIIGSGPAGLSCAYFLAVDGYKVTVFEKETKLELVKTEKYGQLSDLHYKVLK